MYKLVDHQQKTQHVLVTLVPCQIISLCGCYPLAKTDCHCWCETPRKVLCSRI